MQIGLIGGIGPAATDFYYRNLVKKFAAQNVDLEMTIVHADTPTLLRNLMADDKNAQVRIYDELTRRLANAGATCVAITSIGGHFCIEKFKEKSVLPVVNILSSVRREIERRNYSKIGILGTKPVMESKFYAAITSAEIIVPDGELLNGVHDAYVATATLGSAGIAQRQVFETACNSFIEHHNVDAIMLGGTDLATVYHADNVDFELVDCAEIHVEALFEFYQNSR